MPPTEGDANHESGHAHEVATLGNGRGSAKHHGKRCTVLRAVVNDDAEFDVSVAKTWVKLESGEEVALLNDEVRG